MEKINPVTGENYNVILWGLYKKQPDESGSDILSNLGCVPLYTTYAETDIEAEETFAEYCYNDNLTQFQNHIPDDYEVLIVDSNEEP